MLILDLSDRDQASGESAQALGVQALPSLVFIDAMGFTQDILPGVASVEGILRAATEAAGR